ncbi:unannotated protein [freshwater metagenome]|uniref:Unannotated protein n=1 Tax=freshwater metagenome TaxID=449393 RepID=A0A6J7KHV7_9ZZZZ|nr:GIY-YIG nuclease family protein [Actinomycetota bacterium]
MVNTIGGLKGFIRGYGMFWDRTEVDWAPGAGNADQYRLLGRIGERRPRLQVCDFRAQRSIYVLYDDHGPYYVGLARDQDIGNRLRDHTRNHHSDRWDRFSWFGFRRVLSGQMADGTQRLGIVPARLLANSDHTIGDIEALLIQTLGTYRTGNRQQMRFASAQRWEQVRKDQRGTYLDRVAP